MNPLRLRILHISDLHMAGPEERAWRRQRVLGDAWKRNLDELLAEDGPMDLVCFTGDVAYKGRPEEYAQATAFIRDLLGQLQLPMDRLFVVPGNHDIDRKVGESAWQVLRKLQASADPFSLAEWMRGGRPPVGFAAGQREELLARQAAYRRWVEQELGRPDLLPEKSPHGLLGYRSTLRLPNCPFDVHVVGLDSAWAAGDDNDSTRLLLTDDQVGALTTGSDGKPLVGFRLALIHHPLSDLRDGAHAQRLLSEKTVDLLLRGHLHETAVEKLVDPDRTSWQLAAGCLYGSDRWPNAFHTIEVHLNEAGRPQGYKLRFRVWAPGGHWHDDGGVYKEARGGRLTWPPAPGQEPEPLESSSRFVGRGEELDQLRRAVLPGDGGRRVPVSIRGMAGVGKTALAERFFKLYEERFPGELVRLVLDPEAPQPLETLEEQLAEKLGISLARAGLEERIRERLLQPLTLLLVENLDSEQAVKVGAKLAQQLAGCPVLLTGRLRGWGANKGWEIVEVPLFNEEQALALLAAEWPRHQGPMEDRKKLAKELGYLPLALHLAAGYLQVGGYDVASFLRELWAQKLKLEPADATESSEEGSQRLVLASTFEVSLHLLRLQMKEGAERMLSGLEALGHAPSTGFGVSLGMSIAGLTEGDFRRLLHEALRMSLVSEVPNGGREGTAWRIHPLVAELLRNRPGSAEGFSRMSAWFLERLPKLPIGEGDTQGAHWLAIHEESAALVDWLARLPAEDVVRVERAGSDYASHNGPYAAWMTFCERVLKQHLEPDERSCVLWTLALVAFHSGALNRALAAVEEKSRVDLGRNDEREVALASGVRADILQARGQLDEALRIRRDEEVPVYEKLGDVRSRAVTQGKIADILQARGQLDEALRIRRDEEVPVYEKLGDVRARVITQGQIADILRERGQLDEALRIRRDEQLPVFEKLGDVRSRAIAQGKIADILQARGQLDEALRISRDEEVPVFEKLGDVRSLLVARANLAQLYLQRAHADDRQRAAELLRMALRDAEALRLPEAEQIRQLQRRFGLE
jgi:tetratricopeptide (TPR) repeat protein/predicted phosphohydrolase